MDTKQPCWRCLVWVSLFLLYSYPPSAVAQHTVQDLRFRLGPILIGTLQIEVAINNLHADSSVNSPRKIAITGAVRGPFRLVEDYEATASLLFKGDERRFILDGRDNGVAERRVIQFNSGRPPEVLEFSDSTADRALQVQESWAADTTDPLSTLLSMMQAAIANRSCSWSGWIYDGKRRYRARMFQDAGRTPAHSESSEGVSKTGNRRYHCTLVLKGGQGGGAEAGLKEPNVATKHEPEGVASTSKSKWLAIWPFGPRDRRLDFWFHVCEGNIALIESVEMPTPIGMIQSKSATGCAATVD